MVRLGACIALSSLSLLAGCSAAPVADTPREAEEREAPGSREGPLAPPPLLPGSGYPAPRLWRLPLLFGGAVSGEEAWEVALHPSAAEAPDEPVSLSELDPRDALLKVFPERRTRVYDLAPSLDPVWLEGRSSVNPWPLEQELRGARQLSGGPGQDRGALTGLVTSEDGPSALLGYRIGF